MESIVSIFRRGYDNFFELLEDQASLTKFLIEVSEELFKAGYSLALKYDIPMSKAYTELIKVLLSRIIPEKDTIDADVMMKTDDENEKQEKSKTVSLLLESSALNVAEIFKNIDLERIFTMEIRENDISILVNEIWINLLERYKIDKNAKMQVLFKKIFENANMQNILKYTFQNASIQLEEFVKDICVFIMDVFSIFNQVKETSEVQQIAELELD